MGGTTKTSQNSSSLVPQQFMPYYTNAFKGMQKASEKTSTTPYSGRFTPETNIYQNQAIKSGLDALPSLTANSGNTMAYLNDVMSGKYLDPATNPNLEATARAATRPIEEQYAFSTVPGVNDQFRRAGGFSGSRRDIGQALALSQRDKNILDTRANIFGSAYDKERGYMDNAVGQMGQAQQSMLLPTSVLGGLGTFQQQLDQGQIDNALASFEEQNAAPWRAVSPMLPFLNTDVGRIGSGNSNARQIGWMGF